MEYKRTGGTFSLSGSDREADEAPPEEPAAPRHQRKQRQPPLSANSFLFNADGSPNDGILSMYCSINYSKEKLHRFKFFQVQEDRDARKEECKKELRAAQALLAIHLRGGKATDKPRLGQDDLQQQQTQEVLRAGVLVKNKKRYLARLAVEERVDLRDDLNTLLSEIRESLVLCYPYNEHLSRLARRLDKISTHPDLWAKYRPRLVKMHVHGFLERWKYAGYPPNPSKLLQSDQADPPPETEDRYVHPTEECMGDDPYRKNAWEDEQQSSIPPHGFQLPQEHADIGRGQAGQGAREGPYPEENGPSAEELAELRQKQREAKEKRQKLRMEAQQQLLLSSNNKAESGNDSVP
ncbi:hypothetical protein cyc_08050 [Cyclospora cayetanensis]|uniref:Uncharacterized protein n=1 Tax=Cyclospora cayetanensis TaxID=88456 RepID=A0A1D3D817_9EIME|nr:hypothetical protein cyc_08050 [Cyclospora cayetanensis]